MQHPKRPPRNFKPPKAKGKGPAQNLRKSDIHTNGKRQDAKKYAVEKQRKSNFNLKMEEKLESKSPWGNQMSGVGRSKQSKISESFVGNTEQSLDIQQSNYLIEPASKKNDGNAVLIAKETSKEKEIEYLITFSQTTSQVDYVKLIIDSLVSSSNYNRSQFFFQETLDAYDTTMDWKNQWSTAACNSKVIVCLLSCEYIESKNCCFEFNFAKRMSERDDTKLIVLARDEMQQMEEYVLYSRTNKDNSGEVMEHIASQKMCVQAQNNQNLVLIANEIVKHMGI